MAKQENGYDPKFKRELYRLREEEGLTVREALEAVFEKNTTWRRKYRQRLSGKAGILRAGALITGVRRTQKRREEKKTVWYFNMTNNHGTTILNERLSDPATVRKLLVALGIPEDVL